MTKISTIHDTINARLLTIFPSKTRIPNAYSLIDNAEQFLKNGFGLKYNGSSRVDFEICNRRESADFSLVLSSEFYHLETSQTAFDSPTKTILEDAEIFKARFYKTDLLADLNIISLDVTTTSGLANLSGDKYNFLTIEINFKIDYFESIT